MLPAAAFCLRKLPAALLLLAGIGPAAAIVGRSTEGSPVASSTVMVLNHQGRTAGFCTGVVLAPTVVLTAAHCAPNGAELRIHWPGDPSKPALLPVAGVARHPDYHADAIRTRERSIDLALLRLAEPLPDRFAPARLSASSGTRAGQRFAISGYGLTREGEGASSGQLRSTVLAARTPLSAVLLWADAPDTTGACTGDSGGPVVADGDVAVSALVLWSAGKAGRQCGSLTQSLWLSPHRPWIDGILATWSGAAR